MLKYVKVPSVLNSAFQAAENLVENYFGKLVHKPEKGSIEIDGERYILLRATSMSVHFLEYIKGMYPGLDEQTAIDASAKVLYEMAKSLGISDAKHFHLQNNLGSEQDKIASGPVFFAHTGWTQVEIKEESRFVPDDNIFLLFDHPNSFEADCWLQSGQKTNFCTCYMNAGYSSGWVQQSFNLPIVTKEILCRAKVDPYCRFILVRPHKIEEYIREYMRRNAELFDGTS